MPRIVLLCAALAALLVPAAAQAGTPFTVGQGSNPHVVMSNDGTTARAVWLDDVAEQIHFCAIPRGETACSLERLIPYPAAATSVGPPFVINTPGAKVHIAFQDQAAGNAFLLTSSNGGLNWNGGTKIYDPNANTGTDQLEPIFDFAGTELLFPSTNPDRYVYSAKTDATESGTTTVAKLANDGVTFLRDLQLAQDGVSQYVAIAHNGDQMVYWHSSGANPSLNASWPNATVIGEGDDARLANNPGKAPWMMATVGETGARRVEVRQWTGSAFGAPKLLANEQGVINDITANGSAVGAIWRHDASPDDRLRFSVSTDDGATFSAPVSITFEDSVMASMDLALAGDGKGFAIFEGSGDTGTGAKRMIKVANTDALPEPTTTPTDGGGTTKPPGSTTPTTTTPVPPKPVFTPNPPQALPVPVGRRLTSSVAGATITVGLPQGCIPAGRPFVATLAFKKKKRKGNLFVKVTRTDFFIGSRRLKVDRKAPFRQTLVIPNPQRGQSYAFRARAFIKVRRGKAPKKSIRSTLRVCS